VSGSSASFTFNGTAVTIIGSRRVNHGLYNVSLDGISSGTFNGYGNEQYQVSLFTAKNLPLDKHVVVITNYVTDPLSAWLDLDAVGFHIFVYFANLPIRA
jgi:hypothetical protein